MSITPLIFDVTSDSFAQQVVENSYQVPVVLDFWAPWCEPCKTLMPMLIRLAEEYDGLFLLAKVNIDEQQTLAQQFNVRSVPTVKLFRNGQEMNQFTGALPESQIRAFIEPFILRASDRLLDEAEARFTQGDHEGALALLAQARDELPPNPRVTLSLIEMQIALDHIAEANALLQALPANEATEPAALALAARLEFAVLVGESAPVGALEQRIASDAKDCDARYRLAAHAIVIGDFESAMEQLLEVMRRDRRYGDDAGRKGLLKVFEMVGEGELVNRYRRQMFNALH